jgi:hypothetical protein
VRDLRYFDEGFVSKKCDDELIKSDFAIGMSRSEKSGSSSRLSFRSRNHSDCN